MELRNRRRGGRGNGDLSARSMKTRTLHIDGSIDANDAVKFTGQAAEDFSVSFRIKQRRRTVMNDYCHGRSYLYRELGQRRTTPIGVFITSW